MVGATVPRERCHGHAGVARVVGAVVAFGEVEAARELVLRALGVGGVGDGDVAVVDEDLVAPAAEAVLRGIFR